MRRSRRPSLRRGSAARFTVIVDNETPVAPPSAGTPSASTPSVSTPSAAAVSALGSGSARGVGANFDPPGTIRCDDVVRHSVDDSRLTRSVDARIRAIEIEERTLERLHAMQRHLERATIEATNGAHAQELDETEEIVRLASKLESINSQKEEAIERLRQKLSDAESEREAAKAKARQWRRKHDKTEKLNYELIEKMAKKYLEQLQTNGKDAADALKAKHDEIGRLHTELVAKVRDLSEENNQLLLRNQELEREEENRGEELAAMEDLREENDALNRSLKDAMELASDMGKRMEEFVRAHEASAKGWEEKLETSNAELARTRSEKAELAREVGTLKEENNVLMSTFRENERLRADLEGVKEAEERQGHMLAMISEDGEYEERLAALTEELARTRSEKEELSKEVSTLKEENEILMRTFKEAEEYFDRDTFTESNAQKELKDRERKLRGENERLRANLEAATEAEKHCQQELAAISEEENEDAERELREENERLRAELEGAKEVGESCQRELAAADAAREGAYEMCQYLQREVCRLTRALEGSMGANFVRALEESTGGGGADDFEREHLSTNRTSNAAGTDRPAGREAGARGASSAGVPRSAPTSTDGIDEMPWSPQQMIVSNVRHSQHEYNETPNGRPTEAETERIWNESRKGKPR